MIVNECWIVECDYFRRRWRKLLMRRVKLSASFEAKLIPWFWLQQLLRATSPPDDRRATCPRDTCSVRRRTARTRATSWADWSTTRGTRVSPGTSSWEISEKISSDLTTEDTWLIFSNVKMYIDIVPPNNGLDARFSWLSYFIDFFSLHLLHSLLNIYLIIISNGKASNEMHFSCYLLVHIHWLNKLNLTLDCVLCNDCNAEILIINWCP